MRAQDLVCGMWVEPAQAPASVVVDGQTYYFCAEGCRQRFERAPLRYLGRDTASNEPCEAAEAAEAGTAAVSVRKRCPFCHEEAVVVVADEPTVGSLTLEEFEVTVRGEWRRHLGQRAYRREHPRELIRGLIVYALEPASPVRAAVLEELLGDELARLTAEGLNRQQIQRELYHLSGVIRTALARADLPDLRATALAEIVDGMLLRILEWRPVASGTVWAWQT